MEGALTPGEYELAGNVSSQFISGLLFATPLMEAPSTIEVRAPFESRSYVDLTTDAMQKFGVKVSVRARKDAPPPTKWQRRSIMRQQTWMLKRLQPGGVFGRAGQHCGRHYDNGSALRFPPGRSGDPGYLKAVRRKV